MTSDMSFIETLIMECSVSEILAQMQIIKDLNTIRV